MRERDRQERSWGGGGGGSEGHHQRWGGGYRDGRDDHWRERGERGERGGGGGGYYHNGNKSLQTRSCRYRLQVQLPPGRLEIPPLPGGGIPDQGSERQQGGGGDCPRGCWSL